MDTAAHQYSIGGSEVGAIFGCDEYRDAFSLWSQKKYPHIRTARPWRAIVGKALEEGVLKLWEEVTGKKVEYCDKTMRHPERPYMVYTPDAFVIGERRGVDSKVVFYDQRGKWGPTWQEIPEKVQLQCWWYMAATNYDVWDVCALIGEEKPRIYTLERNREVERAMLVRVEEWVARYLVGNEMPPPTGSEEAARWLQIVFPRHNRPDLREASEAEIALLDQLVGVRIAQKALAANRSQFEADLKVAIADKEGLTWPGGKLTWRKTKDRTDTEWKTLANLLLRSKTDEEAKHLLDAYTTTKEGGRRLLLQADQVAEEEAA
jgi:predicted phage-related endonuclease